MRSDASDVHGLMYTATRAESCSTAVTSTPRNACNGHLRGELLDGRLSRGQVGDRSTQLLLQPSPLLTSHLCLRLRGLDRLACARVGLQLLDAQP